MPIAEEAVLEANRRFYEALAALKLEQMDSVWLQEDWIQCVHPGWELIVGWQDVRESWARLFASTRRLQLEVTAIMTHVEGGVAWVACTEQVTSLFESSFDQAHIQATNLFVLRSGAWKMVAHHASPLLTRPRPTLQ